KIFAGCYMEFGYWSRAASGTLEYTSLLPQLGRTMRDDEQIWSIIQLDEWVIFQSPQTLYFYNTIQHTFRTIQSDKLILKIFKVDGSIYYTVRNEGVYKIENGKSHLVIDDVLIRDLRVINIFKIDGRLIFLTSESGFFRMNNARASAWEIPANEILKHTNPYCALQLQNGKMAVGTISDGIYIVTPDGKIEYHIDQENGLSNNTVLSIFEDQEKNLWIGLDNGINCINLTSPIQAFYNNDGVLGTVYISKVFNNTLYLGTNQGLFCKRLDDPAGFKFVEGTSGQVWDLHVFNDEDLLCGHHLGTFVIVGDKAQIIDNTLGTWTFKDIPGRKNLLLKGNYDGLYVMEKGSYGWIVRNKVDGFKSSSRFFELDDGHHIWVNHEYKGVYKLLLDADFTKVLEMAMEPSLTVGRGSSLVKYRGNILYASEEGVYRYDTSQETFIYDSLLSPIVTSEKYITGKLVVDDKDRLWAFSGENLYYVTINHLSNKPKINTVAIPLKHRKMTLSFENIARTQDDIYLLGTANGFLSIDISKVEHTKAPHVYLNAITLRDIDNHLTAVNMDEYGSYKFNSGILNFNFSVPNYSKYSETRYQYQLQGLSSRWSDWSDESAARFENLSFGDYVFKVRAKIGTIQSENTTQYPFEVKRPWYLSNPALGAYFLSLLLTGFITHKAYKRHYSKKLINKQLENERIIIQIKNEQLNLDIENKNRELALSKMNIIKKNELLSSIKKELKASEKAKNIDSVVNLIDRNLNNTKDWEVFVRAFNNTDKGFLDKLKSLHPNLTPNDLRFCVYLRLNLSSKEIAPLLNISVKSVETRRYRLRKRMNLPHEEGLVNYILSL
ncbi:MAG: hypothetical protein KDD15_14745, partial [Lewinella sp.]|nr:hypothetical protein [Lewinella sp.]